MIKYDRKTAELRARAGRGGAGISWVSWAGASRAAAGAPRILGHGLPSEGEGARADDDAQTQHQQAQPVERLAQVATQHGLRGRGRRKVFGESAGRPQTPSRQLRLNLTHLLKFLLQASRSKGQAAQQLRDVQQRPAKLHRDLLARVHRQRGWTGYGWTGILLV
jgi:hypothetical protein